MDYQHLPLEPDFLAQKREALSTANDLLTGTCCGERFCVIMARSDRHKNERSSMCPSPQLVSHDFSPLSTSWLARLQLLR